MVAPLLIFANQIKYPIYPDHDVLAAAKLVRVETGPFPS